MIQDSHEFPGRRFWQTAVLMLFFALLIACGGAEQTQEETQATGEEAAEQAPEEVVEEVESEPEVEYEDQGVLPEAAGSEEGGGSPYVPDKRLKVSPTRVASAGWVDMRAVLDDIGMMRLIENTPQEIVVIHQISTINGRSILMATPDRLYFSQWTAAGNQSVPVHLTTPQTVKRALEGLRSNDDLVEQSVLLACDLCGRGGSEETLVMMWPASGLTLTMDFGERVAEVEPLLSVIRTLHAAQVQGAAARALRLNE